MLRRPGSSCVSAARASSSVLRSARAPHPRVRCRRRCAFVPGAEGPDAAQQLPCGRTARATLRPPRAATTSGDRERTRLRSRATTRARSPRARRRRLRGAGRESGNSILLMVASTCSSMRASRRTLAMTASRSRSATWPRTSPSITFAGGTTLRPSCSAILSSSQAINCGVVIAFSSTR